MPQFNRALIAALIAATLSGGALGQTISPVSGSGSGLLPPLCGDSSHALGGTGTAFTCQAITGSAAAGGSNTQLQYNNAGALGGISGLTTDGTSATVASGDLKLSGSSTGTSVLNAPATGGGTSTLPAGTGTLAYSSSLPTGANPTATIGATAVNGTSTTFLRSDGAPALPSTLPALNGSALTNLSGGNITAGSVANAALTNSSVTVNGTSVALGASGTITVPISTGVSGLGSGVATALAITHDATGGICTVGGSGCPGGGSGTVTSVATGACLTGGPVTTTGTISGTAVINPQTGTTYTILSTDACKLVTLNNASAIAVTLPVATTSGFGSGFSFDVTTTGAGAATITPTTSTINGASTLVVKTNQSCEITSDGTNYQISLCTVYGGTGTVTSVALSAPSNVACSVSGSPVTTTGTLTCTPVGTSGGVPYFSSASALSSSAALAANALVIGGGAGAAPATTTTGTGVLTALGTAVSGSGGICLTSGSACSSSGGGMFNYSDNGVTVTVNTYFAPVGGGGAPQTTEAAVSIPSPSATTVTNLSVSISGTLGVSSTGFTVTLQKNGSAQTLTCTFNPSSATACTDLTHSVTIAQGDVIDWKVVTAGTIIGTPTITIAANNGTSNVGVTSITCGSGLSGGTITTTGTCAVAATSLVTGTSASLTGPNEIYVCTSTCTITPPTPVAGYQFCVEDDATVSTVITMASIASSFYQKAVAPGTANGYGSSAGTMTSGGAVGDMVCLIGRDSTHYLVGAYGGTWTNS